MALPRDTAQGKVDAFYMDVHEVTNAQFSKFVDETGYLTIAERPIDWDEMKKQLPPGTPKPADDVLQGSMVFVAQSKWQILMIFLNGGSGFTVLIGVTLWTR